VGTAVVFGVTVAVTAAGAVWPGVEDALRRQPGALADGEVWRAVTPLLVHPEGWLQVVVDLVGIALVGRAAERALGAAWFLVAYLFTGTVGHLAGAAWDPHSAGSSVAVLGTAGALLAWQAGPRPAAPPDLAATVYALAVLAALVGGHLGAAASGALPAVAAGVTVGLWGRVGGDRLTVPAAGAAGVFGLALVAARDIHGPPTVAGLALGLGLAAAGVRTASSSTGPAAC
jgi:membrane associated rhomboid family serine protease